jgi:hypothetical protein
MSTVKCQCPSTNHYGDEVLKVFNVRQAQNAS